MIIKEDGTGLSTANVYADVSDLDAYALLRGDDISEYTTEQKEGALYVSAQDWIDGMHDFKGEPLNTTQAMKLPTSQVSLPNTDITNANCYTALLRLKGLLFNELETGTASKTKKVRKKLDVLETETEFFEGGQYSQDTRIADNLLDKYLAVAGLGVRNVSY